MANVLSDHDLMTAVNLVLGSGIIDPENAELQAHLQSAEKMMIKVQEYERLSNEAKEAIEMIINGPSEVIEALSTPIQRVITVRSVRRFLTAYFCSVYIAESTIKEIQSWVKDL
jgi:hypothetical protein